MPPSFRTRSDTNFRGPMRLRRDGGNNAANLQRSPSNKPKRKRQCGFRMVGGMVSSTVLTLVVIPALYALINERLLLRRQ